MYAGFDLARFGKRIKHSLAVFGVALAALFAAAGPGHAAVTPVDCTGNTEALQTAINSNNVSGTTFEVTGTCASIVIGGAPFVTIDGGEIQGTVQVINPGITLSNILINGSTSTGAGIIYESGSNLNNLTDVTVQDFPDSGITICCSGASVFITGGLFEGNLNCGILAERAGVSFSLAVDGSGTSPEITGNGAQSNPGAPQGGICLQDGAVAEISAANVHENVRGPALSIIGAAADITGGTFEAPSGVAFPTIELVNGKLNLVGATVTGTGTSSAIFSSPNSGITMQGTTVTQTDAADPTIAVSDIGAFVSLGGNKIKNLAANGIAISLANASTFHQRNETSLGIPLTADTIVGDANVQIQSNLEVGTGTTPTSWTGSVNVVQNSSFRMDGGITITGGVTLGQGSNGFFNRSSGGTNNVVTGGVTCAGSSSHIAGPTFVVTSSGGGTSAVTIVTTGPGCYNF